jgi:hypothetical protein
LNKTFICYTRADSEFVRRLAEDLRNSDADIWLDQWDVPPGQRWDRAIEAALKACGNVIVVLSLLLRSNRMMSAMK